eukprot:EG_transcript_1081
MALAALPLGFLLTTAVHHGDVKRVQTSPALACLSFGTAWALLCAGPSPLDWALLAGLLFSGAWPWGRASLIATFLFAVRCGTQLVPTAASSSPAPPTPTTVLGFLIALGLAYRVELDDRRAYLSCQHLSELCLHLSKHGLEGCKSLPLTNLPDAVATVLETLRQQGKESLQFAIDSAKDLGSPLPQCPNSPSGRRALQSRIGTLMVCRMTFGAEDCTELERQSREFIQQALAAAIEFHASVHAVGAHRLVLSWNLLQFHPTHQSQACHCALALQKRIQDSLSRPCDIVLTCAWFVAGKVATAHGAVPVIHGKCLHVSERLLQLTSIVECNMVMTESVNDAVQGQFPTLPLDHVRPEGLQKSITVYGLLTRAQFVATVDDVQSYRKAFNAIEAGEYRTAHHLLTEFLLTCSADLQPFATRLLSDAEKGLEELHRVFCREDGWQRDRRTGSVINNTNNCSITSTINRPASPASTISAAESPRVNPGGEVPDLEQSSRRNVHFRGPGAKPPRELAPVARRRPPIAVDTNCYSQPESPTGLQVPISAVDLEASSARLKEILQAFCPWGPPNPNNPEGDSSSVTVTNDPSTATWSPTRSQCFTHDPSASTPCAAAGIPQLVATRVSSPPKPAAAAAARPPRDESPPPTTRFAREITALMASRRDVVPFSPFSSFRLPQAATSMLRRDFLAGSFRPPFDVAPPPRRPRRLSQWSADTNSNIVVDELPSDMPTLGRATAFTTTHRDGGEKVWYYSDTLLGAGGFGGVYLGLSEDGTLVAVKQMEIQPEKKSQLRNEIKMLSKFQHPNIVAYLGSAVVGRSVFVVMEYAPTSLSSVILVFGRLPEPCAKRYTKEVLQGLTYLHLNDVIHRDVKPQNVLIGLDGSAKLADFGTAALLYNVEQGCETVIGTPHYMAPEVIHGQVGKEADIWALGVTVWEMLTGNLLNGSEDLTNYAAVIFQLGMMTEAPQIPHDFSEPLREFLHVCLSVDPTKRATADKLIQFPFLA